MFSVEDGRVGVFLLLPLIPVILGCVRDDERDTQGEKQKNQKAKLVRRLDLRPFKRGRHFFSPQEAVETKHRAKTD